jgi:hypothetical protein
MESGWNPNTVYHIGERKLYETKMYKCLQTHTSNNTYTPDRYNSILWTNTEAAIKDDSIVHVWRSGTYYYKDTLVEFAGNVFKCTKNHVSIPYSSPSQNHKLWNSIM